MESSEEIHVGSSVVSEAEFQLSLIDTILPLKGEVMFVTGPGRSGAMVSVYASHLLGTPFVPFKQIPKRTDLPMLLIDTAELTGRTIRKAEGFYRRKGITTKVVTIYKQPPRVTFWYERIKYNTIRTDRDEI